MLMERMLRSSPSPRHRKDDGKGSAREDDDDVRVVFPQIRQLAHHVAQGAKERQAEGKHQGRERHTDSNLDDCCHRA